MNPFIRIPRCLSMAALALCATQAALAQPDPAAPRPGASAAHAQLLGGSLRHEMFLAGVQLEREMIVQGAPYCADAVHESVQTLTDGNRIVQRQPSRQCRDGQGRTRQEVTSAGRRNIYLRDPVAQEAWMLDPEARQAVRLDAPLRFQPPPEGDPRMWDRLVGWSRDLRDRLRPRPAESAAAMPPPEPMRIVIGGPPGGELPFPPRGAMPPPVAFHARMMAPRGPGVVTLLPAETIEGLTASGKRTTWTMEAGRIGNEKPIVSVSEVWTSPDLGITLRSRDADPLAGENSFRVQNVVRGEPDAALFRVPADFRKVQPPGLAGPGKP